MTQQEKVYKALDDLGIEYKVIHHQPVHTIEEMDALGIFTDGELCKNLFLRNANGKTHYVVSMMKDKHPDIQQDIRSQLGCSRLSFGSDERLMKHLGLEPGAVSPFGILNDDDADVHIRWPKSWSFSFNISPSNEHPGLISFRMDWLDLLAAKGLSRVFSNTTVQKHQFFGTQLSSQSNSHPYMTTGKTIALIEYRDLYDKLMSLLFNRLSMLVISFFPRSKRLLISWLQSPSAVILEPPRNKV